MAYTTDPIQDALNELDRPENVATRAALTAAIDAALTRWSGPVDLADADYMDAARDWMRVRILTRSGVTRFSPAVWLYTRQDWDERASRAAQEIPKTYEWRQGGFRVSAAMDYDPDDA